MAEPRAACQRESVVAIGAARGYTRPDDDGREEDMTRRRFGGGLVVALALVAGAAGADERGRVLRAPRTTAEVAVLGAPRAALDFLKSIGKSVAADDTGAPLCGVGECPAGDQQCRQNVFHAVLGCLRDGRLRDLPGCPGCALPGPQFTIFRAHGDGITLYGTVGPRGGGHRALLSGISRAVEAPPLLHVVPSEGGTE